MIYMLLADGFEEIEALEPLDILRRAEIEVTTVAIADRTVKGAHGIKIEADAVMSEVDEENIDMLILPGGAGHELLDASNEVHYLINKALVEGAYIAAICAAPSILGKKGILDGVSATCFPGYEKYLFGAKLSQDKVVYDNRFITAKGAGAAADFGFKLVEILKDKPTAEKLRGAMQY